MSKRWTDEEKRILHETYYDASREKIMGLLASRTWGAIKAEACILRIQRCVRRNRSKPDRALGGGNRLVSYLRQAVVSGIVFNLTKKGKFPRVCRCGKIIGELFAFRKRSRYYHVYCAIKAGFDVDFWHFKTVECLSLKSIAHQSYISNT